MLALPLGNKLVGCEAQWDLKFARAPDHLPVRPGSQSGTERSGTREWK
jgi:hypothetical protein